MIIIVIRGAGLVRRGYRGSLEDPKDARAAEVRKRRVSPPHILATYLLLLRQCRDSVT